MEGVEQLLYLQGVGSEYNNYQGEQVYFSEQNRSAILSACGYQLNDSDKIAQANFELDVKPWFNLLAQQCFCLQGNNVFTIRLAEPSAHANLVWKIYQKNKLICQGTSAIESLAEVGSYSHQDQRYSERQLDFTQQLSSDPKNCLAPGYYQISAYITLDDPQAESPPDLSPAQGELIVYPKKSYSMNKNCWGISTQLYTLVSDDNLGVGDFNDLQYLVKQCVALGADYILLNPLHALFEDQAERASPYSPSDRFCLNPIYIHIQHCPDYKKNRLAKKLLAESLKNKSEKTDVYIDYEKVFSDKYAVFLALYQQFVAKESSVNSQRFQSFQAFKEQHKSRIDSYSQWLIARNNLSELYAEADFIRYLQWLAHEQLSECQRLAKEGGMAIGLINDLAVGCNQDGSEFAAHQELFIAQASIGAPPDPLAPAGQNWGLPPINPVKLKSNGFKHFRQLLRENMRECGALRIDHVMALMRLWWCTSNEDQLNGCYVYYPLEQLLAILTLESELNQCALVGEDLGVVPAEIKTSLAEAGVLSNDLFYFSKDAQGQFIAPEHLPKQTLMMIANHDVATFHAWWQTSDLTLRNELQLFVNHDQFVEEQQQRHVDKVNIITWLNKHNQTGISWTEESDAKAVYQGIALVLAQSNVNWLTLQLDDLAGELLPVNIPGTDKEYPNWRRRLSRNTNELFTDKDFFLQLTQMRQQQNI